MKKIIFLFVLGVLFFPRLSLGQESSVDARLQQLRLQLQAISGQVLAPASPTTAGSMLPVSATPISRELKLGDRGEDVRQLQSFLRGRGHFKEEPTGYFGPVTMEAVRAWQLADKIITNPANGGVVGPRSLAALKNFFVSTGPSLVTGTEAATFTILYPEEGQSFSRGDRTSVSWRGGPALVDIIFSRVGGQPVRLVSGLTNRGFFPLVISDLLLPGTYVAKVVATGGTQAVISGQFTIR